MSNKDIASIFYQIAEILDYKQTEKNRFRIIAYEKAAQTIANETAELSQIYSSEGLKGLSELPGIGESIALKIEELLKTGKLKYLEEIKKDLPVSELEFLKIPGIGPKMAFKISRELGAVSISDLKKKIETKKAQEIFKEKTRLNIIRGIDVLSKLTGRLLISEALPIAEEVVSAIKKFPETKKAEYVGSLRRMKETVGDIDIVATSDNPVKVIERFTKLPFVSQVITQGESKSTIIHKEGVQIDLQIVPAKEFGSLLQHFTGSKEHNVALRTFAQTKGMSVSEHGIKKTGKQYKFSDEKGVYEFLGMDYIEPELREDQGEIQAAINHNLPNLVKLEDIKGDLHVHSNWSDGKMSIAQIAKNANELGYKYISISDHTVGLGIANGLDEKRLRERQKEINRVQIHYPKLKLLSSAEVNIKADGTLDINDEMLEELDIVIASVHTSFNQPKEKMTERVMTALRNKHIDIIGHPSGRIIGQREPYEIDWSAIFKMASDTNTAMEISSFPNRLDLWDNLIQEALKHQVKFSINTDAHQDHHLSLIRFGVSMARRGWLTKDSILNAKDLAELVEWTRRKG